MTVVARKRSSENEDSDAPDSGEGRREIVTAALPYAGG
jgi:hypothetical protein